MLCCLIKTVRPNFIFVSFNVIYLIDNTPCTTKSIETVQKNMIPINYSELNSLQKNKSRGLKFIFFIGTSS